jgi:SAM-dependent methyltransferase
MQNTQFKHLDLGCGTNPFNPYHREIVYGIDIREDSQRLTGAGNVTIIKANLALEMIPFEDSFFDSISAIDFLEHIPRQLYIDQNTGITYPFINLMNEIWRALKPGGKFLAITPAFPSNAAFADPTHVNAITSTTHEYFCGTAPVGRIYGFNGAFRANIAKFSAPSNYRDMPPDAFRSWVRDCARRLHRGGLQHVVWELEAIK